MATEATGAIEVDSVVILVAGIAADLVVLRPGLEEATLVDRHLEWADRLQDSAAAVLAGHRAVLAVVTVKADSGQ